jgi:hypothetical protein
MSFPDKLPVTTFAVGIAAAFQAAGAASPFWTACAWCIVIAAAAGEAAFRFLSRAQWKQGQKYMAAFAVIAIVAPFIFWTVWQAYRKEFLTDDLRLTFNVPHPSQIGTDGFDLNYVISNKGSTSLLIEEIIAVEIATTDFSNNPSRNGVLCKPQVLGIPGRGVREIFAHPGRKVLHEFQNRPILPEAFSQGEPAFPDDEKIDMAIYEPKKVLENGKEFAIRAVTIETGGASSFTTSFDTDPVDWGSRNVIVICGAIKYLASAGQEMWAACPAYVSARTYKDGKPSGALGGPAGPRSFTINAAESTEGFCGVRISY